MFTCAHTYRARRCRLSDVLRSSSASLTLQSCSGRMPVQCTSQPRCCCRARMHEQPMRQATHPCPLLCKATIRCLVVTLHILCFTGSSRPHVKPCMACCFQLACPLLCSSLASCWGARRMTQGLLFFPPHSGTGQSADGAPQLDCWPLAAAELAEPTHSPLHNRQPSSILEMGEIHRAFVSDRICTAPPMVSKHSGHLPLWRKASAVRCQPAGQRLWCCR